MNEDGHYFDEEERCYRDALYEIRKGHIAYVYSAKILNMIIDKMPNIKINRKEFYWEVSNDI